MPKVDSPDFPQFHANQIREYSEGEHAQYEKYAEAMERVFKEACKASIPEVIVQARAKTVSSFAEKVVRKAGDNPDPVHKFTDLCGARIILHTREQIEAVHQFVTTNFIVHEVDHKELRLGNDKFGYIDRHFIVSLNGGRAKDIGFSEKDIVEIGTRKAELQVRTILQHAWADILHDRMYKTSLKHGAVAHRTSSRLAAVLEDCDLSFGELTNELDGSIHNYASYFNAKEVEKEVKSQESILEGELAQLTLDESNAKSADDKIKVQEKSQETAARAKIKIAQLWASVGEYESAIKSLTPHADVKSETRFDVWMELGHALCHFYLSATGRDEYKQGQKYLLDVVGYLKEFNWKTVPNLQKNKIVRARALARLAWTYEQADEALDARNKFKEALELEPNNPYHLANQLGFELKLNPYRDQLVNSLSPHIKDAIDTCREHALMGTELPYAYFTAGRLSLLLTGGGIDALGWYARGLRHVFDARAQERAETNQIIAKLKSSFDIEKCGFDDDRKKAEHNPDILAEIARKAKAREEKLQIDIDLATHPLKRSKVTLDRLIEDELKWIKRIHYSLPEPIECFRVKTLIEMCRAENQKLETEPTVDGNAPAPDEHALIIATNLRALPPEFCKAIEPFLVLAFNSVTTDPFNLEALREKTAASGMRIVVKTVNKTDNEKPVRAEELYSFDPGGNLTAEKILSSWSTLIAKGITPRNVTLLSYGGGDMTAAEVYIAIALGAFAGVVTLSGGASDSILNSGIWSLVKSLFPIPKDAETVRALLTTPSSHYSAAELTTMAKEVHAKYLRTKKDKIPPNLRPWESLSEMYQRSNEAQVQYMAEILAEGGYEIREMKNGEYSAEAIRTLPKKITDEAQIRMAKLEHGRWNIQQLRNGWRFSKARDEEKKLHDNIVRWEDLSSEIQGYDHEALEAFPEILKLGGYEIIRSAPPAAENAPPA